MRLRDKALLALCGVGALIVFMMCALLLAYGPK